MLRNKTPAPSFALPDEHKIPRSLEELRGNGMLLCFFFRFAACPTSQRDLLAYADVSSRLPAVSAQLVAISADTVESHRHLKARLGLRFPLLSDSDFAVSERYGVYRSDEVEEGPQPHGEPAVVILDIDGNIAYSQVQSGPKGTADPAALALVLMYMAGNGGRYW
jgi:peroxiredoxin Q/BCP